MAPTQAMRIEERQVAEAAAEEEAAKNGGDGRPMMSYHARQMNSDHWAHNVLLVGDEHWNCLKTADDDVAKEVKRLGKRPAAKRVPVKTLRFLLVLL